MDGSPASEKPRSGVERNIVLLTLNVRNLIQRQADQGAACFHGNASFLPQPAYVNRLFDTQGKRKILNWFEEIVKGIDLITVDGILCQICNKNQADIGVKLTQFSCCGHSIHLRHLDVHQNHIRIRRVVIQKTHPIFEMPYDETASVFRFVSAKKLLQLLEVGGIIFYNRNTEHENRIPLLLKAPLHKRGKRSGNHVGYGFVWHGPLLS